MMFRSREPGVTKTQMLAARPTRLVDAEPVAAGDDAWRLTVPLATAGWAGWILRVPPGATKTFELDALGKFVWDACDGRTNVRQVIARLAKRYNLNEREAEVATIAFLHTLVRKGIIGMQIKEPQMNADKRR